MGSDTTLDVTAIVISYNSEERIAEAVEAHQKAFSGLQGEVIVVDNASEDNSVAEARRVLTHGRVIANTENVGYGAAANQAIVEARGRACLVLNDDARLEEGAIERLMEVLFANPKTAMVGPRIVDEQGNQMPSARLTYPGPGEEWERLKNMLRGVDKNTTYPPGDDPIEVAWLVGACILGRTDLLRDLGGFSPAYFLYVEDIDLARRSVHQGYHVLTVPDAVCIHTGSVSTGTAFGRRKSIDRRTLARDIYYRIWEPRFVRSLIHLRRAIGISNQPGRLQHHLPKVFWDGPSLRHFREIDPLPPDVITTERQREE